MMGQPKAKWEPVESEPGCWEAAVGYYVLSISSEAGEATIWFDAEPENDESYIESVWKSEKHPAPCDIVYLMLLAEAELERRLRGAAETMDGKELVAEQSERGADTLSVQVIDDPIQTHPDDAKESLEFREWIARRIRTKFAPEPPFHAGECLIHGRKSTECGCATLPAFSAKHTPGSDCSACEAYGTHCLPIGSLVDGRCKCCGPAAIVRDKPMYEYSCKECGVTSQNTSRGVDLCPPCRKQPRREDRGDKPMRVHYGVDRGASDQAVSTFRNSRGEVVGHSRPKPPVCDVCGVQASVATCRGNSWVTYGCECERGTTKVHR